MTSPKMYAKWRKFRNISCNFMITKNNTLNSEIYPKNKNGKRFHKSPKQLPPCVKKQFPPIILGLYDDALSEK